MLSSFKTLEHPLLEEELDVYSNLLLALTKALYPDPIFSIREYAINAIEANARRILLKFHNDRIEIHDNGHGMTREELTKALCPGASTKDLKTHVGWIGIGIYSAVPYCEKIIIITKRKGSRDAYGAVINSKELYEEAMEVKKQRKTEKLRELLRRHIHLPKRMMIEDLEHGTTVILFKPTEELRNKNKIREVLQQTIPLPFDKDFPWGEDVEKKVEEKIGIKRTVEVIIEHENGEREKLRGMPQGYHKFKPPIFFEHIEGKKLKFFGWICLHKESKVIPQPSARGIYLRKPSGVCIANPFDPLSVIRKLITKKRISRTTALIQWAYGEVYVLEEMILNAEKTDFQPSEEASAFFEKLSEVLKVLDDIRGVPLSRMESRAGKGGIKENIRIILEKLMEKKITFDDLEEEILRSLKNKPLGKILEEKYNMSAKSLEEKYQSFGKRILENDFLKEKLFIKFEEIVKALSEAEDKSREVEDCLSKLEEDQRFKAQWLFEEFKNVKNLLIYIEDLYKKCIFSFIKEILKNIDKEIKKAENERRIIGLEDVKSGYEELRQEYEKPPEKLFEKITESLDELKTLVKKAKSLIDCARKAITEDEKNAEKMIEEARLSINKAIYEGRISKVQEASIKLKEAKKAFGEKKFSEALEKAQEALNLANESEVIMQPSISIRDKKESSIKLIEEISELLTRKIRERKLELEDNKIKRLSSLINSLLARLNMRGYLEDIVNLVVDTLRIREDP